MKEFIITFGQKYAQQPHPKVDYAHPDGYLVVEAENKGAARDKAVTELGEFWAFCYTNEPENTKYFPMGELHRI